MGKLKKTEHVVGVRYENNISVLPDIPVLSISQAFSLADMFGFCQDIKDSICNRISQYVVAFSEKRSAGSHG